MVRHPSEPLMPSCFLLLRAIVVAGVLVSGLAACGRRGTLEPPPDPSVAQGQRQHAQVADEDEAEPALPSPVGTPRPRPAKRGYVIPKDPFILDPLL
jgi:predicted small lipoprotein YifL